MFFGANSEESNNHSIISNLRSPLDHASLTISIIITEEFIQNKQWMIVKNSIEEESFTLELKNVVRSINTTNIPNYNSLGKIVDKFILMTKNAWNKHLK